MKKLLSFILCLLSISSMIGQTLRGTVLDKETHEPLAGVNISYKKINGEMAGTISDAEGMYELRLPNGGADVLFSYIGYENKVVPVILGEKETKVLHIYMQTASTLLSDVVISAGRFEQRLSDVTVSLDLLKAEDISRQAPTDLSATLNTMPGVDINDKQPSIRGGNGWMYGIGSRSAVLVDGMNVLSAGSGVINWNVIPMENIQQVEVLKGASSVLYGSSALNGVINIRTKRPSLTPQTTARAYLGIYGNPARESYQWSSKSFWKEGKYEVEPFLRKTVFAGIRNPIYEGADFSHARRIGNFDVSAGINLFTDEGYREQGYNKRFRAGGNLTYHQPMHEGKILNYGFNMNYLSDQYADFFIWRSPEEAYRPSAFANMGREGNTFYIDPFLNFTNPNNGTSHKLKGRFYYRGDNIIQGNSRQQSALDILGNMGTDVGKISALVQNIQGGDFSAFTPILTPIFNGDLKGTVDNAVSFLNTIFPTATTADYCDLLAWMMQNGLPSGTDNLIPWLSNIANPKEDPTSIDKNYTYYIDYQFTKEWENGTQIIAGATFEHMKSLSKTTGAHESDNAALYFQYDQRFFDRLSVSAGMRAEYYRVDDYLREANTKVFNKYIPIRPIFRAGLNYQLADYSFLRASIGQGYRYPSLTEKYARKDIGGVGVYPNQDLKAEKGMNAELGFKQGYQLGAIKGFFDIAGFYTQYSDMIEFRFGFFNNNTFAPVNSVSDVIGMLIRGEMPGIGAQFYNVSKARIYGAEVSTTGVCELSPHASLTYNLGYIYLEPEDIDYKKKNELESTYTDPLQMKEKSNTSRYLKYRQKHTFKTVLDFNWKRLSLGTNIIWKSKTLAVDYIMVDERPKAEPEIMDYVRDILFGNINGETLHSYWQKQNTDYCVVDLRAGIKITNEVALQFMINNLFNKEYSTRPMAVAAPRTYVMQLNLTF